MNSLKKTKQKQKTVYIIKIIMMNWIFLRPVSFVAKTGINKLILFLFLILVVVRNRGTDVAMATHPSTRLFLSSFFNLKSFIFPAPLSFPRIFLLLFFFLLSLPLNLLWLMSITFRM